MGERPTRQFIPVMRLERVVFVELAESFGLAAGALTLVFAIAGAYGPVRDGLPLGTLVRYLPSILPIALPWTMPTAFVGACIMVYSRMAGSNELTAVCASGVHVWRVLTPAVLLGVVLSACCAYLNHEAVPEISMYRRALAKSADASKLLAALQMSDPVMRVGRYTIYAGEVDDDHTLRDIVIVLDEHGSGTSSKGGAERVVSFLRAPKGSYEYVDEQSKIVFRLEGDASLNTAKDPDAGMAMLRRSTGGPNPRDFEEAFFPICRFEIQLPSLADMTLLPDKGGLMTTEELVRKVQGWDREMASGRKHAPNVAGMNARDRDFAERQWERWLLLRDDWSTEIHARSAMALSPLLLCAIAIPLGLLTRRGHALAAFGLAIALVLAVYYPLMAAAKNLGQAGQVPPEAAVWGTTGLIAGLGLFLIRNMLKR